MHTTNKTKRIAICKNEKIFNHFSLWTNPWIEFCEKNGLTYEIVDCYQPDIIKQLQNFDCLLWHFSGYVLQDMLSARSILSVAKNMGLKVFPDINSFWHFDDKVAETYLLQSVKAPIPESWMFYLKNDACNWLANDAAYPIVAKLRCGSGSSNVKLLKTKHDAIAYVKRMFSRGYKTAPSVFLKSSSLLRSSKNWDVIKKRARKIPEFLHTLLRAKMFPKERGYVFFQEFIPNDGFDLKIVVIGDKLSFIARNIRKGDFRASGGGDLFFDKSLVTPDIINSAFTASDKAGFECMGYDYVVDKRDGKGKIVEISYGFSHTALLQAGGYWDRSGMWHDQPLNAPEEVIRNLIQ